MKEGTPLFVVKGTDGAAPILADLIELYDLKNDPREIHNLAKEKNHKKTLGEMRALLAQRQKGAASAR